MKTHKTENITAQYFTWRLYQRKGYWYADGRGNRLKLGRHSLGVQNHSDALEAIRQLDLLKAIEHGLADRSQLRQQDQVLLPLEAGRRLYMDHTARPRVAGGAKTSTTKRYKSVFDKFFALAHKQGISTWNQINSNVLLRYCKWLEESGYSGRTQHLEVTTLKQTMRWLSKEKHLPHGAIIDVPLRKPQGTDTYCWSIDEVDTMLMHCRVNPKLGWLGDVLLTLAVTGLRISELASLRWTDVDFDNSMLRLIDESMMAAQKLRGDRRTLKSSRGRSIPISTSLADVLNRLPRERDNYVFHGPRGGRLKPDSVLSFFIRHVIKPLKERFPSNNRVGFRDGRLHSFRHYFCSRCANEGLSELAVMEWLGHRVSAMVKYYYHLFDRQAHALMAKVEFVSASGGIPSPDRVSEAPKVSGDVLGVGDGG